MVINKHFSVFIWLLSLPALMSDQVKVDVLLHFSLLKTIAMDSNATKYINLSQNLNSNWFQVNFSAKNDDFYIENDQSLLVDPFNEPWIKILGTISRDMDYDGYRISCDSGPARSQNTSWSKGKHALES